MATEGGKPDSPLTHTFFEEAYRFDFFQAVRLLERIYPRRHPIGRDDRPADEVTRFRARASLEFPPSQIYELLPEGSGEEGQPPQMTVAFMGLAGPVGALPTPYTELVLERTRYRDTALRDFLDLFNHRLISLFYRAWEKYRFPVAYERNRENPFTECLFDFVGMGTGGLRGRLGFPDEGLLLYGGLIAQRPHSVRAIEAIVGDYFRVTTYIQQFSGQWLVINPESLTRLGQANSDLGINAVLGERVWDRQSKFRLRFGPLTLKTFKSLLPNGSAFKPATELTRFLAGMEFDFDIQLILRAEEVPACQLLSAGEEQPMLGWTTWLKTRPFAEDDSQVVLAVKS